MEHPHFHYGEDFLTSSLALEICRNPSIARLSGSAIRKIHTSAERVASILNQDVAVYGLNTGFGPLCRTRISPLEADALQHNLLKSHSAGVGKAVPAVIARLMLVLKIHSLSRGFSGVRLETIDRLMWHLKEDVLPIVPRQGSVGASGDLAPLAHLCLPLIGLGKVTCRGKIRDTREVLQDFGLTPIQLGPKEGLALINGTQFMAAYAVVIVDRLFNCLEHADLVGSMTLEALLGSEKPFDPALHALRPYGGSTLVAAKLRYYLHGSEIMHSHLNCDRVQDPYSLRCIPQVHGASRNAWLHLREITETELNAVTDNPVILPDGEILNGGNFHGQPIALPLDYAALAAAELGNIADRRVYLMLEGKVEGLPKLLMRDTGLNSGFMLPQYTTAALVSENKSLCFPASADSVPTSLGQEDHVSMGSISGRKTLKVVKNLEKILAIELLAASQAFDFRRPLRSSPVLEACHAHIRRSIDHASEDRVFAGEIQKALQIIRSRNLTSIAQSFKPEGYGKHLDQSLERYEVY